METFNEELIQVGFRSAIAVNLYQESVLTLEKAAKFSGCSAEAFIEILNKLDIPVVDYQASELAEELKSFEVGKRNIEVL